MKRKAEIRFCALGFLCLVVIVVAAMTLSETVSACASSEAAKGIRLTEGNSGKGNSQTELVTAIADVVGEAQPQIHAGIYTMTASETEMRFTDGEREIYAERTPNDYIGEAGPKGIRCIAVFGTNDELLWWEEIAGE